MMADPSSCFVSAGPGFFQIQHGEKYIQLKNYTDQLEAELRETKSKMQALTTSNDELRECKTLKAQPSTRQFPSPTRSTMGGISMQQQDGGALVTQANQFNRPSMRSMGRAYAVDASTSSMRNSMANMGGPETPRTIQRPNVGMGEFSSIGPATWWAQNSGRATENTGASISTNGFPFQETTKINPTTPVKLVIPFSFETILEAIDSSTEMSLGSSSSQVDLKHLSLELADTKDLLTESTAGDQCEEGIERLSLRISEEENASTNSVYLSSTPSRPLASQAPLNDPQHIPKGANRSPMTHSAPRVAQRYQLRHPDDLIAEASEQKRIVDECKIKSHPNS
ncbi:uncharacterized protein PITG_07336 [Phytophthora infestans T30-4]|uniref:Uncharacterized protein n=1 Tax=Phytophthora infestans (strain T30-4) TaxID=403677 RepID=D0N7U7_PHYIT|nr:uncharacterized protein PITG_07336 [Phytophthora infestans T30-4]EEY53646.1 hypothetical protein PITG_07336 [Phytophthora infestans T30-4]|eukprot:XP_002905264.1 hypothetical protein PITG_07336 [Phytophthora infestans T30-4]